MTVAVEIEDRIGKCRKILDSDPNSQIFAALAEAYRRKGELEKAFRTCQGGLRIHPSYGSAHIVMAKINLDRGLYDWAEAEVNKAIELDGRSRAIELLLAEVFLYKGDCESAVKLLRKLSEVDPDNDQIRKLLNIARKIPQDIPVTVTTPADAMVRESVVEDTLVQDYQSRDDKAPAPSLLSASETLKAATLIPNVKGVLFINGEGLVVDSEWSSDLDATTCGAALAEVSKFLNQELMKASFGEVSKVLIETGEQVFYLLKAENGLILVVGNADINLGSLRMKIADLLARFRAE